LAQTAVFSQEGMGIAISHAIGENSFMSSMPGSKAKERQICVFGSFYELRWPKPWTEDDEYQFFCWSV